MHAEYKEIPVNGQDLHNALNVYAEDCCRYLLSNGKREGTHWVAGNIHNENGKSLKVCLEGSKTGLWNDFATGDCGNLIMLWMKVKGMQWREACHDIKQWLGISTLCEPKKNVYKSRADSVYDMRNANVKPL